jgi:hypothetical protein
MLVDVERCGERRITLRLPVSAASSHEYTKIVFTLRGGK